MSEREALERFVKALTAAADELRAALGDAVAAGGSGECCHRNETNGCDCGDFEFRFEAFPRCARSRCNHFVVEHDV